MTTEEQVASDGLDVVGYSFKWKQAQQLAHVNDRPDHYTLLPYWERVRLLFFELGGARLRGEEWSVPDA